MNRLLIVDDEKFVLESLTELFAEQDDMDLEIHQSANGREALDILGSMKIDVVLLDIKMPGLSGIEVFERVNLNWPSCRIIFLTGYSSFEDIYHLIKNHKVRYLLKIEDNETIIDTVKNALEDIEIERRQSERMIIALEKQRLLAHLVQNDIFSGLIKGVRIEDMSGRLVLYGEDFGFTTASPLIIIFCQYRRQAILPEPEKCSWQLSFAMAIEQALHNRFRAAFVETGDSEGLIFLQPFSINEFNDISPYLYVKESLNELTGISQGVMPLYYLLILYDKPVEWHSIAAVYELLYNYAFAGAMIATQGGSCSMVFGESGELEATHKQTQISSLTVKKLVGRLSNALHQGDKKGCYKAIDAIAIACGEIKNRHALPVISVYQTASLVYMDYIIQYKLQETVSFQIGLYYLFHMDSFSSWDQAFEYLSELTRVIFSSMGHLDRDKTQRLIRRIKHYIDDNLASDLSLTSISNEFNYNSAYISRVFKQSTGINLSAYIMQTRIEKAKDYLIQTKNPIQSIAELTGFGSSQYFSLCFKKKYGLTPKEYRI